MRHSNPLIPLILVFPALAASGCGECCEEGSGHITSELRDVSAFDAVRLELPGTVYLRQDGPAPLRIETDDNLQHEVRVRVRNGELEIDTEDDCLDPTELRIYASTDRITQLEVAGSGEIEVEDTVIGEGLKLAIAGSGNLYVDADLDWLETVIFGSGDLFLSGQTRSHEIDILGSGDVSAYALDTESTYIDILGSGDCRVTVSDYLNVDISGSGDVTYQGNPRIDQDISGSGDVRQR